jgi:hypothetical protein
VTEQSSSVAATGEPASLGSSLLDRRLAHRDRRLALVVRSLDARASALSAAGGSVPHGLVTALAHFRAELAAVQAALRQSADADSAPQCGAA